MSNSEEKCPQCGQQMPALEPPPLVRQCARAEAAPEEVTSDCEAVNGFCQAFSGLALKIPPSVRSKVTQKLDRCGIDPATESDDVRAVLESAIAAYTKKRESARVSSAKRRAEKKAAAAAAAEPAVAE